MMDDQFDQEWIAGALEIGIWKLDSVKILKSLQFGRVCNIESFF